MDNGRTCTCARTSFTLSPTRCPISSFTFTMNASSFLFTSSLNTKHCSHQLLSQRPPSLRKPLLQCEQEDDYDAVKCMKSWSLCVLFRCTCARNRVPSRPFVLASPLFLSQLLPCAPPPHPAPHYTCLWQLKSVVDPAEKGELVEPDKLLFCEVAYGPHDTWRWMKLLTLSSRL